MPRRTVLALVVLAAVVGAAVGGLVVALWPAAPPAPPPGRAMSLHVPSTHDLLDIAVSADASLVAYTAIVDGRTDLYVRPLDRFDAAAIPGTEGATQPFFSPDGSAVGFFADGFLKTITLDTDSGTAATVCPVSGRPAGGAWREDGVIVFAGPNGTGLRQVSAVGGAPTPLTMVDEDGGETAHGWPSVIDRRFLLYTAGRYGHDPRLMLLDLDTGESRPLLPADGGGFVVAASYLVYARRGELFAAPLELIDPTGAPSPRPVLNGVASSGIGYGRLGKARFAASRDGTMVFVPPPATGAGNQLVWVDRDGRADALDGVVVAHGTPRLSPDGRRVVFGATTAIFRRDLWLYDFVTGRRQQITEDAGDNHSPLWSASGTTLTFASSRGGLQRLFQISLPSLAASGPLVDGDQRTPGSWSHDERRLAFHEVHPARGRDVWMWTDGTGAEPWLATDANERAPRFSPDGRWIAYVSDEEGEGDQVYLRRVDDRDRAEGLAIRVSPIGGTEPVWGKSGSHLFFRRGRGVYESTITGDEPDIGDPVHLFDGPFLSDVLDNLPAYDVAENDERFLMLMAPHPARVIHVVSGWLP